MILYVPNPGSKDVKHGPHGGSELPVPGAPQFGVRMPAEISADGYSVAAGIPEGVGAYRFILIDAHTFQIFGDVEAVERIRLGSHHKTKSKQSHEQSLFK
jgi:hypothetical protein